MHELLLSLLQIAVSLTFLVWSADRFVVGSVVIAQYFKISPMLIGLTIVAIGTSAPEIMVAVVSAIKGNASIGVGNAVGSNIANIGLVLGGTALVHQLMVSKRAIAHELIILVIITAAASFLLWELKLNAYDGIILLGLYIVGMAWLIYVTLQHRKLKGEKVSLSKKEIYIGLFWFLFGLILLPISSNFLVDASVVVARQLGISELIIGLTIIAVGTSLPELATSIMGVVKGEYELAIGNVIGSNIANLSLVLGPIGVIKATTLDSSIRINILIMLAFTFFMLAAILFGKHKINKTTGGTLFVCYALYLIMITASKVSS